MKIFILLILSFKLLAEDKTQIKDLEFLKDPLSEKIKIHFNGKIYSEPILSFRKNMVQLEFPNALVWPKIEKKFTFGPDNQESTMMAYQFDPNLVRIRAFLPYNIEEKSDKFTLVRDQEAVYLEFPGKKVSEKKVDELDEKYLAKLLIEKGEVKTPPPPPQDKLKIVQSSLERKDSEFSLAPFIGKFAGFLVVVLLIFFALVHLFKRTIQGKGKSGFLNGMNAVEILSTTYIGPKKNLLLVKVYKQILLLGVSESGVNFLTEINEPTDFLKSGEEHLTGSNFDKNLAKADAVDKGFALKKNDEADLERSLEEKKKEKFTDQIKKKIQQLKPLQ
jgi:flagellar biosynthetic protein FliO